MNNTRILTLILSLAAAYSCPGGSLEKALPALPGDIVGALVIGNLAEADSDYRMLIEGMGLADRIPEEQRHPLARLKEKLPGLTGFDEKGSLALMILKSSSLPELMTNAVVLIPASDTARLLDDLGGDPVSPENDKVRSVLLFGRTMYATIAQDHVAVAQSAEVAGKLRTQKATLRDRLPAHEVQALAQADVAIWLDAAAILALFKPQIDGLIGWGLMMQMGAGEVGEEEARASKKQIDTIVDGLASLLMVAAISKEGVSLRFLHSARPDTELARQTNHAMATSSLLRGLPRRNYLAVFGQELHPDALRAGVAAGLDPLFAGLRSDESIDREKLEEVRKNVASAVEMVRAIRGSIDHMQSERDGMLGVSLILETTDSSAWLELVEKICNDIAVLESETPTTKEDPDKDEEAAGDTEEWTPDVTWERNFQKLEDLSVARFHVDVFSDPELDDDDREEIKMVLGDEGLTFRVAVPDPKTVAMTFGGHSQQMGRLIRSIRQNQSPLEDDPGFVMVNGQLPEKRSAVAVIAFDRIVNFANSITYKLDPAEPITFWLPPMDAPLGIATTGGSGWSRYDLFTPMPLLSAVITAAKQMEEYESLMEDSEDIEGEDDDETEEAESEDE